MRTSSLFLLGGFDLRISDRTIALPTRVQRLVAFLAVHRQPLHRLFVAGSLWPDVADRRASASLRSALWNLRTIAPGIIEAHEDCVRLNESTAVDMTSLAQLAGHLTEEPVDSMAGLAVAYDGELLPDWYEDWVTVWQERWRQIRLHALETVAHRLTVSGWYAAAIDAGLAAVRAEPLRESSHRAVIEAHLAEGNASEAVRQFRRYEFLARRELGVRPSPLMLELVRGLSRAASNRTSGGAAD